MVLNVLRWLLTHLRVICKLWVLCPSKTGYADNMKFRIPFQMLWTYSKVYNLNSIEAQEPEMIKISFESHFKCYLLYEALLVPLSPPPSMGPLSIPLSLKFSSVIQSCLILCDPMGSSTPGFPVLHHPLSKLLEIVKDREA